MAQNYHRRAYAHDYHAPFIYHLIIKKAKACANFGSIRGDAKIAPGKPGCAFVAKNKLGGAIATMLKDLQLQYPFLQVYQYAIMPDHIHILLRVKERTELHLSDYIRIYKQNVVNQYNLVAGTRFSLDDIFEPGYCDKPLLLGRSLETLFRYIRENPHRLAMRQQYPDFFRHVRRLSIGDNTYEAYGNLFLYRNPDKVAVKISRSYDEEKRAALRAEWLETARTGGILVSPFISPAERSIREEAEALGAKIILITHEAFGERYKPAAHDFEQCAAGRMMIISMGQPSGTTLTRELCLQMNDLAATLAKG